jgi:A/G-specific adenine glycosylase
MNIGKTIIAWYNINKRDLPWRNTIDPYTIWVSEIIMQQTRINQGLPYYLNFIEKFPTVFDLANAKEEEVLLAWQGLGYYSRARNMLYTAKDISTNYNGIFPTHAHDLKKLKGIGQYTAAAISSICNKEIIPAIDGNVIRVISRLYNIKCPVNTVATQKEIKDLSCEIIKELDAASYNQAMMDLGASICTPKNPKCNECPLQPTCLACKLGTFTTIPLKENKTKVRTRHITFLVFKTTKQTLIKKRVANDIWKGLYEFPVIESNKETPIEELLKDPLVQMHVDKNDTAEISIVKSSPHKLSHQTIKGVFLIFKVKKLPKIKDTSQIEINTIDRFAFPRLLEKHFENIFFAKPQ